MFYSEGLISHPIASKFLVRLHRKLLSSVNFLEYFFYHGYGVIQISNFSTQTGSVQNVWKFLVAEWTELTL